MTVSLQDRVAELEAKNAELRGAAQSWRNYAEEVESRLSAGGGEVQHPRREREVDPAPTIDLDAIERLLDKKLNEKVGPLVAKADLSARLASELAKDANQQKIDAALSEAKAGDGSAIFGFEDHFKSRLARKVNEAVQKGESVDIGGTARATAREIVDEFKADQKRLSDINKERAEAAKKKASLPDAIVSAGMSPDEYKRPKTVADANKLATSILEGRSWG